MIYPAGVALTPPPPTVPSPPQLPPLIHPQQDGEFEAGAAASTEPRRFLGRDGGALSVQEQSWMTHFCSRMQPS